jgi:hypothetical protein
MNKKIDRWRLDTSALNQQYEEFRQFAKPLFNGFVPYDNRHTGATNQHKRAADYGISGEAVALYDNHDYLTALTWYIAPLFEEVEIICRYPDELVVFCEQMIIYSILQYILHPWQLRHIAAIIAWGFLLGRTQLRQQLKLYRARKFDLLGDSKDFEQTWKTLCLEASRQGHRPTIKYILSLFLQRLLNRRGDNGAETVAVRRTK